MSCLCNATELSDYIVDKFYDTDTKLTNLKLQRILYVIQIAYCYITNGGLMFPNRFIATDYGPMIPEVRERYNPCFCRPTSDFIKIDIRDTSIRNFVDSGIEFVSDSSPWRINDIIQEVGSPWHTAYTRSDDHTIRYDEFIKYYGATDRIQFDSIVTF